MTSPAAQPAADPVDAAVKHILESTGEFPQLLKTVGIAVEYIVTQRIYERATEKSGKYAHFCKTAGAGSAGAWQQAGHDRATAPTDHLGAQPEST